MRINITTLFNTIKTSNYLSSLQSEIYSITSNNAKYDDWHSLHTNVTENPYYKIEQVDSHSYCSEGDPDYANIVESTSDYKSYDPKSLVPLEELPEKYQIENAPVFYNYTPNSNRYHQLLDQDIIEFPRDTLYVSKLNDKRERIFENLNITFVKVNGQSAILNGISQIYPIDKMDHTIRMDIQEDEFRNLCVKHHEKTRSILNSMYKDGKFSSILKGFNDLKKLYNEIVDKLQANHKVPKFNLSLISSLCNMDVTMTTKENSFEKPANEYFNDVYKIAYTLLSPEEEIELKQKINDILTTVSSRKDFLFDLRAQSDFVESFFDFSPENNKDDCK